MELPEAPTFDPATPPRRGTAQRILAQPMQRTAYSGHHQRVSPPGGNKYSVGDLSGVQTTFSPPPQEGLHFSPHGTANLSRSPIGFSPQSQSGLPQGAVGFPPQANRSPYEAAQARLPYAGGYSPQKPVGFSPTGLGTYTDGQYRGTEASPQQPNKGSPQGYNPNRKRNNEPRKALFS